MNFTRRSHEKSDDIGYRFSHSLIDHVTHGGVILRKVLALFASGTLALGISTASAQSDPAKQGQPAPVRTAEPAASAPLAPGAAAGIKQAQGAQRNSIWRYAPFALVGGLALLVVLATGDDDNDTTSTTGSN